MPLSGVNGEMVITVAWEISWYQYRVSPDAAQPVRLAERGHDLAELEPKFAAWNARLNDDGRLDARYRAGLAPTADARTLRRMIYCVIPRELEAELYDKLVEYYKDNPNVTVDRSTAARAPTGARARDYGGKREIRDRRRARAPGTFPSTDPPEAA